MISQIIKPRTICIYGESGATKTTQAYHLAKYIHAKLGLTGRMIGANGSDSAPFEDSGMIAKGVVDFFDISNRKQALADMRRLGEGYWPQDGKDSNKNIIPKGYFKSELVCATSIERWAKLGFLIVEGITGISNLLLNHCRSQDEGVGFKHGFKYEEDGYVIGGLQPGHYGLVQQELYKLIVQGFATFPLQYVIWTALTGKGEDNKATTYYGPQGAGQATTYQIPSWFMDCWHLDKIIAENDKGEKVEKRVAWFMSHNDTDTGIPYLAKIRCMPEIYPSLLKLFPNGYVELGFKSGLEKFYKVLDELNKRYQASQTQGEQIQSAEK